MLSTFEFSLNHKKDVSWMAEEARKISDAIDEIIAAKLFEKEN